MDGKYQNLREGFSWRVLILAGFLTLVLTIGPGCGFLGGGEEEPAPPKVRKTVPKKPKPGQAAPQKGAPSKPGAAGEQEEEEESKLTFEKLLEEHEAKMREYVFKAEELTDPFRPIQALIAPKVVETETEEAGEPTPLQKMELSQFKLVAIVMAEDRTRALVEDSAGMGYIIEKGTRMGTQGGKVVAIHLDRVEIEESFRDYLGKKKTRVTPLKLKPIEGE